jgi:hypothetical protein
MALRGLRRLRHAAVALVAVRLQRRQQHHVFGQGVEERGEEGRALRLDVEGLGGLVPALLVLFVVRADRLDDPAHVGRGGEADVRVAADEHDVRGRDLPQLPRVLVRLVGVALRAAALLALALALEAGDAVDAAEAVVDEG